MNPSNPQLKPAFSFFDTETTGIDPYINGHRVIEAAVLRTAGGGEVVDSYESLVNPGRPIPAETIPIHGITDEMVADAPSFDRVLPRLLELFAGTRVVIHNAPFDLSFLDRAIREYGLEPIELDIIDTLTIARRHCRFPGNALRKISRYYRITSPLPHRATHDVEILREVFSRMLDDLGIGMEEELEELSGVYPTVIGEPANLPPFWQKALDAGVAVPVLYRSRSGITRRKIEPIDVRVRSGRQYLIAYCRLRRQRRTFRLDRLRVISDESSF